MLQFRIAALTIIIVIVSTWNSFSQGTLDTTAARKYPKVVLVQLRSERNRVQALTRSRSFKELREVESDARNITDSTIKDFHEHFSYCPVFYYMDTNADLVRERKFEGILLREDLSAAKDIPFNKDSNDYVVVYFGYPIGTSKLSDDAEDSSSYAAEHNTQLGRGLVILNSKFQQINYVYKFNYGELFASNKKNKPLHYKSRHFDMEYIPLAEAFNDKLTNRSKKNAKKKAK